MAIAQAKNGRHMQEEKSVRSGEACLFRLKIKQIASSRFFSLWRQDR